MNEWLISTAWMRADVRFAIGVVIAALVTVHVLLRKRATGSAVGWIGLSWFAPITGGLIYFVFGINRVQRRARRLRRQHRHTSPPDWPAPDEDEHLDPLKRGVGRITERPAAPGNALDIFHDGDQAYPAMLAAIAAAKHSIGLSSYIFDADATGQQFIDALAAAKARGVAVRVLIDGVGGGYLTSHAYHHLRRAGVAVDRFLHTSLPWRMPFLNLRSHKKILVIDGSTGFTGGMNISADNVMASHPKTPVQDTHFRVTGPVMEQLVDAFVQDWAFVTDEELDGDAWYPALSPNGPATSRVIDSGPDQDIEKVEFAILQAIACARQSVQVMTPYFLPDDRLITALSLAAMRGVAVDIIIPSASDHRMVDWATRANLGPLLEDGATIWLSPPPFRHSKTMVVDGEWCLVGSSNWDMRSFRLNFEMCLEVYDRTLAQTLTELMESSRGQKLEAAHLAERTTPLRLRDAAIRLVLPYL